MFSELCRHMPAACFATDENGQVVEWNKAAEELYGYSRNQAVGHNPQELIGIGYATLTRRVFQGKEYKETALTGHRADGRNVRVLASLYPVRDEEGSIIMAASVHRLLDADYVLRELPSEVDEIKRRDSILAAISEAASLLLRAADMDRSFDQVLELLGKAVGVSRIYVFSNQEDEDGRLLINKLWEWVAQGVESQIDNPKLQGLRYDAAGLDRWLKILSEGKPVFGLIDDFPDCEQKILKTQDILSLAVVPIFTGDLWWGAIGFDDCRVPREWTPMEVDVLTTAARFIGAAIEHRRVEKQLRYWSEFNRNIVETSSVAIYVLDTEARIRVWNRGMEEQSGIKAGEVLGEDIFDAFPLLEKERLGAAIKQALKKHEGFSHDELIHTIPLKGVRTLQVRASPLFDGAGKMEGLVVIYNDVTDQRNAEQKLEESEEMYRALTESALIGFCIYGEDRFLFVNRQMSRITGYSVSDLLKMTAEDLIAPDDLQRLKDDSAKMKEGKDSALKYTFNIVRKDGKRAHLEVYTRRTVYQGKPVTIGNCIDITDRMRDQTTLLSSEKLYRTTINSMGDIIHVVNRDMEIVMHNLALRLWAANLGLKLDDVVGHSVFEVFPFLPDKVRKEYAKVWKTGKPLMTQEETVLGKDIVITETRKIPVRNKEGEVERVVTVVRDITEAKGVEQALRESEAKYSALVEQARDGVVIVQDEICHFTNAAMSKISGYSITEIVGMNFGDLIIPKSKEEVVKRYKMRMGGQPVPSTYEAKLRSKDGQLKDVEISTAIIKYKGQDAGMGIIRDITERKRAEEEIRHRSNELSSLLEISTAVSATLDVKEVIQLIAVKATELIRADGCTIYRFDPLNKVLAPQTTTLKEGREERLAYNIPLGKGITGKTALQRKPILVNNVQLTDDATQLPGTSKSPRCLLAAPLLAHGELWGVMTLIRLSELGFVQHDLELLGLFANQVADAAVNSSLFSRLSESEEKYRSFVEQAIDGIVIIQDERFVFANRGAGNMLGYSPEEITEMDFASLLAPEVREDLKDRYQRRMAGEKVPNVYETSLLSRKGEVIEAELNADIIHFEGRPAVLVFARDISERKQAEEALRKERDKAQRYLDVAGVTMVVIAADQKVALINRKGCDILGYKETEIIGKNWFDHFIPEHDRKEIRNHFEEMMRGEREPPEHMENSVLTRSGQERMFLWHTTILKDDDGSIIGTLSSGEDITERKRAQEALGKERTTLKQMIDLNPYAIAIYDGDGRYISGNQAFRGLFKSTHPTKDYSVFEDPAIKEAGADLGKVKDGKVIRIPEIWYNLTKGKPDQEGVCVRSVAFPIFDPSGEFENLVIMHEDITDRKRAEEALQASEERYRSLQINVPVGVFRIDSKGRIITANPALVKMLGFDSEEELVRASLNQSPLADIQNIADSLYKEGSISDVEMEFKKEDGSTFWGSVSARKVLSQSGQVHHDGIIVDVSERKRVEEALREGERFLSSIFGSIQDGLSILDKNLSIIRVNSTMETWYPHAMPLIGKKCYQIYHNRDEVCEMCPTRQTIKSGRASYEVVPKRGKGGEIVGWLDLYSFPLIDLLTGKMQGVIQYVRDITDRKKAEEALRESEERYRSLFEDSPISLWEEDLSEVKAFIDELKKNGIQDIAAYFDNNPEETKKCASLAKVIDVNKFTLDLYGAANKQELLGGLDQVFCDESYDLVKRELIDIAKGKTIFEGEGVNQALEGQKKDISLRLTAAPGHEKDLSKVLVSITDVTERKQFEKALRESEEFSRAVIEHSPLGISVRSPKGQLLTANDAWKRIWAISEEDTILDMKTERKELAFNERDEYLKEWFEEIKAVYRKGKDLHIPEIKIKKPRKGGARWVSQYFYAIKDTQGNVNRIVILTEDITNRKQAEEALKESERVLSTLMSNLPGMAYRCANDKVRNMEFVSEGCANLTGYQPIDLIQSRKISYGNLIHAEDMDTVLDNIETALAEGKQYQLEYRIVTAWGDKKWVWEMGRGVFSESGNLVALEGFVSDVTDRKKAAQALKESEELYRSLIETSPDSIALTDLEGKFTMVNQRMFSLHGVERVADLMDMNFFDLVVHDDRSRAQATTKKVLEEGRVSNEEYTMLKKDGSSFPGEISASLVVGAEGKPKGFIIVTRDITERKEAQEALDREHKAFRIIAEAAVHAVDIPDLCQRVLSGLATNLILDFGIIRLFDRNHNTLELKAHVGLTRKQLKDMLPAQPLDDPRYIAAFVARRNEAILAQDVTREVILKPFHSRLEGLGIRSLVSWPVTGTQGDLLGVLHLWSQNPVEITDRDRNFFERVIGMFSTVLERKRAEEALRASEEHYRTLVDTAQEGISLVGPDEKFIFVNPKMAELMGCTTEELIGKNLLDFVPSDDAEFIERQTSKRQKGETSRYEATLLRSDGTPINVLITAAPIFNTEGKFSATLGVLTDITELKKAEEELRVRLVYQTVYAQIMNKAIRMEDFDLFIEECLEILGHAFNLSRIYLAVDEEEKKLANVTHEWLRKKTVSVRNTRLEYAQIPTIHERLLRDELIADSVVKLPSQDQGFFKESGSSSVILVPIHSHNGFYGFIAADDCTTERELTESEIQAFRTSVRLITTVIDRYFEEQERRIAEEARAESEQRYRTLVETSSDIIFLLSDSGELLYISPAVRNLGYEPDDLLNEPNLLIKAFPPDEFMTLKALYYKAMRDEYTEHEVDCEVFDRQGSKHWFSVSGNWIRDEDGKITAMQGMARDITERKQTEGALRLRMKYEKVLWEISSLFLTEGTSDDSLRKFLERLGQATGVSRVNLFSHREDTQGRLLMRRRQRWVAETYPKLDNDRMDELYYDHGFGRWLTSFSSGEAVHSLVEELPREEQPLFKKEGILSILVLPIFVEGKLWGAIGFDETKHKRVWNDDDIRLLWTASQILSAGLATESKALELAQSYDGLKARERQISELNLRLVKAEEDERRRIARVLHDEIAQQLTGVALLLSTPELNNKRSANKRLNEAKNMVKETQKFIRDLSYELRPPALDNLGLVAAVRALSRSAAEGSGVSFVLDGTEELPRTDPDTEIMLYRIIQEAVGNSLKHAQADEITVSFDYEAPILKVSISDDGKGFDFTKTKSKSSGLGLRSIHERVALIGGKLTIDTAPEKGTRIKVEVEIPNNSVKMPKEK